MKYLLCVIFLFSVLGCSSSIAKKDGLDLSVVRGTSTAVVKVRLDENGMPAVDTDPIVVREGQRIVWAGPTDMTIRFVGESPAGKVGFSTRDAVVNLKIPKQSSWNKGEEYKKFKYDVVVGDQVLDPIIIIRRGF